MPLFCWLAGQVHPGTILALEGVSPDVHFGFCQATAESSPETLCILLQDGQIPADVAAFGAATYGERCCLQLTTERPDEEIDILCIAGTAAVPGDLQLSERAVVLRTGLTAAETDISGETGPRLVLALSPTVTVTFVGSLWQTDAEALQAALGTPGAPGVDRLLAALGRDLLASATDAPTTERATEQTAEAAPAVTSISGPISGPMPAADGAQLEELITLQTLLQASETREDRLAQDLTQLKRQLALARKAGAAAAPGVEAPAAAQGSKADLMERITRLETAVASKERARFLLEEELRSLTHDFYERDYAFDLAQSDAARAGEMMQLSEHAITLDANVRDYAAQAEAQEQRAAELSADLEAERRSHLRERATLEQSIAEMEQHLRLERRLQAEALATLHRLTLWPRTDLELSDQ
ncbi:hypothetical protein [Pseudooceanicola nanhaiensis]|uniref:hypothetical protein n=1 Tax=Pseudooceanicola nanhaiensis TaxID=375761 RepID=UPI001CD3D0E2|nr:hypothetical protein [Pseudooceanicola nanhaiensis]MCA0922781.1 hypothetical protein [Pseudooceanicola nanhaiensis]